MIEFFVSPNGNDAFAGTTATHPFQTIGRAVSAVRDVRSADGFNGATVNIMTGIYSLAAPVRFSEQDSGSDGCPIIYKSYNGPVRINGGVFLNDPMPVNGIYADARISPSVRAKIACYDLKAEGIADFGTLRTRRYATDSTVAHLEVFFNSAPLTLARFPKENYYLLQTDATTGKVEDGFYYDSDRPNTWKDDPDIRVHGYWAWDWEDSCEKIGAFDKTNRHITIAPPYGVGAFKKGQRFYFVNVLEEMDRPGEYYVDINNGILYLYPPDDINTAEVIASTAEFPLFELQNASNLTFSGLTFECGRSDGFSAHDYRNIVIDSCCFRNFGNRGAVIKNGKGLAVKGSDFYGMGDGCLDITGGNRMTLESGEIEICNNDFHHFSRWVKCYMCAINITAVGARIHHNIFHDAPHSAVYFYGNEFDIEYNDFYNVCLDTGDAGAMYISWDLTFRGIRVRNNRIRNMNGNYSIGTFGFYTDGVAGGCLVENNHFNDIPGAICNNGGADVYVKNNVCVNAKEFVNFSAHGMNPGEEARGHVTGMLRPSFYKVNADRPPYSERYPDLAKYDLVFKTADRSGAPALLPPSIYIENNVLKNVDRFIKRHWLIKDEMITESGNVQDHGGDVADFDQIGLTDEPRFSVPVKVISQIEMADRSTLRLTVRNDSASTVNASMRLFDNYNHLVELPENLFEFNLSPGETAQHDFTGCTFGEAEYVEARSPISGVRPCRVYVDRPIKMIEV